MLLIKDIYNLYPDLTVSLITFLILLTIGFTYFGVLKILDLIENKFKIKAGSLYTYFMLSVIAVALFSIIFNCTKFYFKHFV
jgi:hypothetical protein